MKYTIISITLLLFLLINFCHSLDSTEPSKDSKSAFGPAFDEIVVESSLTVRRKNGARQARNQNGTTADVSLASVSLDKKKTKREVPVSHEKYKKHKKTVKQQPLLPLPYANSAVSNSQAQSFSVQGPVSKFGASASGTQSQSVGFSPNGPLATNAFSGTQQYTINGQTVDIAFGNSFGGVSGSKSGTGGVTITVSGTDGKKIPLNS